MTKRERENPKITELPASEGDRNIPLNRRMEESAIKNEYARIAFWEMLVLCIEAPVCRVPHFSIGMD